MKQVHNLTAGTIISGTFCWSSITRPVRLSLRDLKEKAVERLSHYRQRLLTLLTIALFGALFLSGSYLFFVQLAKHGW